MKTAAARSVIALGLAAGVTTLVTLVTLAATLNAPALAQPKAEAKPAAATPFAIDTVHSAVVFRIKHMGVSYSYGRFNDISGTFLLDPANLAGSSFDVTVKAESVDTANAKRDAHLRSPDFFSAKEFPTITFKSTAITAGPQGSYELKGDLTLHGQTKPATAQLELVGTGAGMKGGELAGVEALLVIKRSDFGMNFMVDKGMLGDEVYVKISLEGGR